MTVTLPASTPLAGLLPDPDARLRDAAERLEAGFLKEMLRAGGLGRAPGAFGGGAGEEQWASALLDAQALALARSGGIGLAESLFQALKARDGGRDGG